MNQHRLQRSIAVLSCTLLALALLTNQLWTASATDQSSDGIWQWVITKDIKLPNAFSEIEYRTARVDLTKLQHILAKAPLESDQNSQVVLSLPLANGSWSRFEIHEISMIEPALAQQYPEIKTYRGQSIDHPSWHIALDWTIQGFHGAIYSEGSVTLIDPTDNPSMYLIYEGKEFLQTQAAPLKEQPLGEPIVIEPTQNYRIGESLRIYRLAVATTGEFSAAVGGTVQSSLAAVVTIMNRVNAIFEQDLAVRMTLIGNNSQIIYTDAATDPYTGGTNNSTLITENQSTIDSIIGSTNYDIGHLFTTNGGGRAQLYSPCSSNKARAASGAFGGTGYSMVGIVAHEMGHQFGAGHTFNGTTAGCNGNRSEGSAVEPGSGSTIMSYAGSCNTENLQRFKDHYFHGFSILQMNTFVSGSGAACAQVQPTNNAIPVVEAGNNFTIPAQTPFKLTGSASDADGDSLTYTWEEIDLGNPSPPNTDDGSRPLFRSFPAVGIAERILPTLSSILNNTTVLGEALPTTSRSLNFRLTVRDNKPNGGGVTSDVMQVSVIGTAGPFAIVNPASNTTWIGNSTALVSWNVAGTNTAPVNCANVTIDLSYNSGLSFPVVLVANTPNDGSETITVPNQSTTKGRVRIRCDSNIFFNISKSDLSITTGTGATATPVANCENQQTLRLAFSDTLENGSAKWLTGGTGSTWNLVTTDSHSASHSWFASQPQWTDQWLQTALPIDIPAGTSYATLRFWQHFNFITQGESIINGGVVEYSLDNGQTWVDSALLLSINGYNGVIGNWSNHSLAGRAAFVGQSLGHPQYQETIIDLRPLQGTAVLLRFRLGTYGNGFQSSNGWNIDDVRVEVCEGGIVPTATPAPDYTEFVYLSLVRR